jgi:hypothetical protein
MLPLSAHDLLAAWDMARPRDAVDRALGLLAAACHDDASTTLAELTLGDRNARLLSLREATFGSRLTGLADCPSCGERLELEFDVQQVRIGRPDTVRLFVDDDGNRVEFRLPNSLDLAAIRTAPDLATARHWLFERCITNGVVAADAYERLVDKVAATMAEADPQGDVRLSLTCPSCGREWEGNFDVASFVWAEVHAWALRTLREVHQLASAYGWSEADILAMSPTRRQAYLELLSG